MAVFERQADGTMTIVSLTKCCTNCADQSAKQPDEKPETESIPEPETTPEPSAPVAPTEESENEVSNDTPND